MISEIAITEIFIFITWHLTYTVNNQPKVPAVQLSSLTRKRTLKTFGLQIISKVKDSIKKKKKKTEKPLQSPSINHHNRSVFLLNMHTAKKTKQNTSK